MQDYIDKIFRHGDVDGIPIELTSLKEIPKDAKKAGKIVRESTQSGHSHTVRDGQVYKLDTPIPVEIADETHQIDTFLKLQKKTVIEHQEHPTKELLKGDYVILPERQYNPFDKQIRRVVD